MKKSSPEFSRSTSLRTDRHKHSISSILKDPSKSKLKHNRSVRFLDLDSSSDSSLGSKSTCQQQHNLPFSFNSSPESPLNKKKTPNPVIVPSSPPKTNPVTVSLIPKFIKRESYVTQTVPTFIKKVEERPKKTVKKVVEKPKTVKKNFHSSASPRIEQKVMNFEFRDSNFYAKLNKYISTKVEPSSDRCRNLEGVAHKKSNALNAVCNLFSPSKGN